MACVVQTYIEQFRLWHHDYYISDCFKLLKLTIDKSFDKRLNTEQKLLLTRNNIYNLHRLTFVLSICVCIYIYIYLYVCYMRTITRTRGEKLQISVRNNRDVNRSLSRDQHEWGRVRNRRVINNYKRYVSLWHGCNWHSFAIFEEPAETAFRISFEARI